MIPVSVRLKRPAVPYRLMSKAVIPWVVRRAGGSWHVIEPHGELWEEQLVNPEPIAFEYDTLGDAGDLFDVSYPTAWDERRLFRFELVDGRLRHVDEGEDHDSLVLREAGIRWPA